MHKQLKDYFLHSPKRFYTATRRDLCSVAAACMSSSGALTSVATSDSPTVTWSGDGTAGDPLVATVVGDTANPPNLLIAGTDGSGALIDGSANVITRPLTGLSIATNSNVVATDDIVVGMGKLQAQINTRVTLTAPITGYAVGANTPLAAADTILGAFGKVQGQINARIGLTSPITGYVIGANTPLVAADTLLASLGKLQGQVTARVSLASPLTGYVALGAPSPILATDTILQAFEKIGAYTSGTSSFLTFSTTLPGGFFPVNAPVSSSSTVVQAFEQLQGQITSLAGGGFISNTFTSGTQQTSAKIDIDGSIESGDSVSAKKLLLDSNNDASPSFTSLDVKYTRVDPAQVYTGLNIDYSYTGQPNAGSKLFSIISNGVSVMECNVSGVSTISGLTRLQNANYKGRYFATYQNPSAYTVLVEDTGSVFKGSGSMIFTLPDISTPTDINSGLEYTFYVSGASPHITIVCDAGANIIIQNSAGDALISTPTVVTNVENNYIVLIGTDTNLWIAKYFGVEWPETLP